MAVFNVWHFITTIGAKGKPDGISIAFGFPSEGFTFTVLMEPGQASKLGMQLTAACEAIKAGSNYVSCESDEGQRCQ